MSSAAIFIEEQLARKEELISRIEMMRNHLAGKTVDAVGTGVDYVDTTEGDIKLLEEEVAEIDARVADLCAGNPQQLES